MTGAVSLAPLDEACRAAHRGPTGGRRALFRYRRPARLSGPGDELRGEVGVLSTEP